MIVNVPVKDIECDEILGIRAKRKEGHKAPRSARREHRDAYCFVAIERTTKLVLNFALGRRASTTDVFIEVFVTLRHRELPNTTDGFRSLLESHLSTLADRVDFAQLIKYIVRYRRRRRYSPAEISNTEVGPSSR